MQGATAMRHIPLYLLCVLLLVALCAARLTNANPAGEQRGVVHTVFLWLKQPDNQAHREHLMQATQRLRQIPGVLDIRFGEAISSDRTIVDDSFDVGVYFYFNDVASMNRYLVHPLHQKTVQEDIKPLVSEIRAHDFHDMHIESE